MGKKEFKGLRTLTVERKKLDRLFREQVEAREKEERERYAPKTTKEVVGKCTQVKCKGEVVRVTKVSYKYTGSVMEMRIGGPNPMTEIVDQETSCQSCRLLYSNSGKIEPKKKAARSR